MAVPIIGDVTLFLLRPAILSWAANKARPKETYNPIPSLRNRITFPIIPTVKPGLLCRASFAL
jgi:hypothetical protein